MKQKIILEILLLSLFIVRSNDKSFVVSTYIISTYIISFPLSYFSFEPFHLPNFHRHIQMYFDRVPAKIRKFSKTIFHPMVHLMSNSVNFK